MFQFIPNIITKAIQSLARNKNPTQLVTALKPYMEMLEKYLPELATLIQENWMTFAIEIFYPEFIAKYKTAEAAKEAMATIIVSQQEIFDPATQTKTITTTTKYPTAAAHAAAVAAEKKKREQESASVTPTAPTVAPAGPSAKPSRVAQKHEKIKFVPRQQHLTHITRIPQDQIKCDVSSALPNNPADPKDRKQIQDLLGIKIPNNPAMYLFFIDTIDLIYKPVPVSMVNAMEFMWLNNDVILWKWKNPDYNTSGKQHIIKIQVYPTGEEASNEVLRYFKSIKAQHNLAYDQLTIIDTSTIPHNPDTKMAGSSSGSMHGVISLLYKNPDAFWAIVGNNNNQCQRAVNEVTRYWANLGTSSGIVLPTVQSVGETGNPPTKKYLGALRRTKRVSKKTSPKRKTKKRAAPKPKRASKQRKRIVKRRK